MNRMFALGGLQKLDSIFNEGFRKNTNLIHSNYDLECFELVPSCIS